MLIPFDEPASALIFEEFLIASRSKRCISGLLFNDLKAKHHWPTTDLRH